ncbi:MAG: 16S rRNA (cytosine(1402)-N(4))-methyltransferase RsmH, partial [bacterium]
SDMKNVTVVHGESSDVEKLFFLLKIPSADIIFADLGVSSHQFDTDERGFSFSNDGPLDMRMNIENKTTAGDLIKEKTVEELQNILSRFAQERESKKVARALKNAVENGADTTFEIRDAVNAAKRYGKKRNNAHLAKIFMALRMAVNDETGQLEKMLKSGFKLLSENGVMGILTFHSVEDRIVKRFFRDRKNSVSMDDETEYCGDVEVSGPFNPSEEEISKNSRSRSARLRILRKNNKNKRRQ